jgi:hypothetical protein
MDTYWLLGSTQTYHLSLRAATRNRVDTISGIKTENMEEHLTLASNSTKSMILKVPTATFDDDELTDPTSPLTRKSSPMKNNVLNKMKEKQSTCPFSGAHLL